MLRALQRLPMLDAPTDHRCFAQHMKTVRIIFWVIMLSINNTVANVHHTVQPV